MKAELILRRRFSVSPSAFVELVAWRVPVPLKGSAHDIKYRFAYVVNNVCVLRYDNEAGKGDHIHVGDGQRPYQFISFDQLMTDFLQDVENYKV